jgi:hypothetical protein
MGRESLDRKEDYNQINYVSRRRNNLQNLLIC